MGSRCEICLDTLLIPRLLNCLHYFCQCCIEGVQTADGVSCVKCGEITTITSARQLPCHPLYFHNANSTAKEVVCVICEEPASNYCVNCDDEYCESCCTMHQKMKVSRNHTIRPSSSKPRLLTCEEHLSKILKYYCMECNKLLCEICISPANASSHEKHKFVTSEEATQTFDKLLQNHHLPNLNDLLDDMGATANRYREQQRSEQNRGAAIKQEINFKTQYLISLLQSREKELCEEVDKAVQSNVLVIDSTLERIKENSEKLETFANICRDFRSICKDNLLLQVKPLIEKRYETLVSNCTVPHSNPCLDSISWVDGSVDSVTEIVNSFGELNINKCFKSSGNLIRRWDANFHSQVNLCNSGNSNLSTRTVMVIDSEWESQRQKIHVKESTLNGDVLRKVWACSRTCKSETDILQPVLYSDKRSTIVGIGHEVIMINNDTSKTFKFGNYGSYPGQVQCISSLAFSSVGNVLLADQTLSRISMFSGEGEFILCFGTSNKKGSAGEHSLVGPRGLVVDTRDQVYVADTGNHRIAIYNHEGCYMKCIGSEGSKSGQFKEPVDLSIRHVLAVLDQGNQRIQFINLDYDNTLVGLLYLDMIPYPRHMTWVGSGVYEPSELGRGGFVTAAADLRGHVLVTDTVDVFQFSLGVGTFFS